MASSSTNPISEAEVSSSSKKNEISLPMIDKWLAQLLVVAPRSQLNGHNLYLWEMVVDQALSPRSLLPHLTQDVPPSEDPLYKR